MDKESLILETALLAGTILMESNAEAYRTEETMNFILHQNFLATRQINQF